MSGFNEEGDGFTAKQIFRNPNLVQAYTYDDIILMPGLEKQKDIFLMFV
jgi:hypothetical protein